MNLKRGGRGDCAGVGLCPWLCPSAARSVVCDDRAQIFRDSDCHLRGNPFSQDGLRCDTWAHAIGVPIREVLAKAGGTDDGLYYGGVLDADLQQACYKALAVPRHEARLRALDFSWAHAAQLFDGFLVSAHQDGLAKKEKKSQLSQRLV